MSPSANEGLQELALALGRVPSGLFILTVCDGQRETGMLASWVQQCSFEPPQVSVAVKHGRDLLAVLKGGAQSHRGGGGGWRERPEGGERGWVSAPGEWRGVA